MGNEKQIQLNKKGAVLCFGDSNTWGYDPRSYLGGQYPEDVRWTGILNLETEWQIFNHGQNGREIPHDASRIYSAVDLLLGECERLVSEPADGLELSERLVLEPADELELSERQGVLACPVWIWIMLGSNDLLMNRHFRAEDVAARMEGFLRSLLEDKRLERQEMDVRVRLIAPPVMQKGTWVGEERLLTESRRLGDIERELANSLNIAFTDAGSIDIPVAFDGVHLSPEGHRAFTEEMKKWL